MDSATVPFSIFCRKCAGAASAGRCSHGRSGWRAGSAATTHSFAACPFSSAALPSSLSSSTALFQELPPSPTPPGMPVHANTHNCCNFGVLIISSISPINSSQSRADILTLALSVTDILAGLVWLSIRPKSISPVRTKILNRTFLVFRIACSDVFG